MEGVNWSGSMVLDITFNNMSVISWQLVLLVEELRVSGKNTELQITDALYHVTPRPERESSPQHQWGYI